MESGGKQGAGASGAGRRYLIVILIVVVVAIVIVATKRMFENFIERNFVFYPVKPLAFSPPEWGMEYEDVFFETRDGLKLNAWLITAGEDSPMVLWFHGNAGNIADRVENARFLYDRGLSVFLVDYRGYGKSEGEPSEKGIYKDGQAAYEYLVSERGIAPQSLVVFGRSLGSVVAVRVASDVGNRCAGVILETAMTNMADMARVHYPVIPGLGSLKRKFDSIGRIASISAPILFIHGDMDELVPYELGRRLYDAATAEKEFYTIRGAHHNDTYVVGGKEYFDRFERFVREKTGKTKPPERQR